MGKIASALTKLKAVVEGATVPLAGVEQKCLFGSDNYFVNGNAFLMVLKEGRVALRAPQGPLRTALRLQSGTELRGRLWVLVPLAWHQQPAKLRAWSRKAHALAKQKAQVRPAVFKKLKRGEL